MVNRLICLPLSLSNYKKEYDHIINLAIINGYDKSLIDKIVHKHSLKLDRNNMSTLFSQNETIRQSQTKRVAITFSPN